MNIATTQFKVTGMTCGHCSSAIEGSLRTLNGVREVQVELGTKTVTISYASGQLSVAQLRDAVEDAGYPVDGTEEVSAS